MKTFIFQAPLDTTIRKVGGDPTPPHWKSVDASINVEQAKVKARGNGSLLEKSITLMRFQ
jgi:hypothetical protein